jgi:hypothetical protein
MRYDDVRFKTRRGLQKRGQNDLNNQKATRWFLMLLTYPRKIKVMRGKNNCHFRGLWEKLTSRNSQILDIANREKIFSKKFRFCR